MNGGTVKCCKQHSFMQEGEIVMKRFFSALTVFFVMFLQTAFADFDHPSLKGEVNGNFTVQEAQDSKTNAEVHESAVLPIGRNGEFSIKTNGSYVYNTPSSDLTGYETTDKWLFDYDEDIVCMVHSDTQLAIIKYYPTDDNSGLSTWELIKRCIESTFSEKAAFFDDSISLKRDGAKLVITSVGGFGAEKVYSAYTFLILKNGIICITSNSSNDESAVPFVEEIAECIVTKEENGYI